MAGSDDTEAKRQPVNVVRPLPRLKRPDDVPDVPRARWHAVHTNAREEWTANYNIRRAGFWTFYPVRMVRIAHARKEETVLRPFLPRYVFAQVLPRQDVFAINALAGVSTVIFGADGPAPIDDAAMARLMARARPDGLVVEKPPEPLLLAFKAGQSVQVVDGPFDGRQAIVEEDVTLDVGDLLRISVDIFGRATTMSLPAGWVRPIAVHPDGRSP